MTDLHQGELRDVAARLFWWKGPDEALADARRFVAQAMTWSLGDMRVVVSAYGEGALRAVLGDAPAGMFDRRPWDYWHTRLGIDHVPPLPRRRL